MQHHHGPIVLLLGLTGSQNCSDPGFSSLPVINGPLIDPVVISTGGDVGFAVRFIIFLVVQVSPAGVIVKVIYKQIQDERMVIKFVK